MGQLYFVWLMMNVIVGLMPIFSDVLDGKGILEEFPSLLLVYVVLLGSSSHIFFKQKEVLINNKLFKFSISMVWIMMLLIISSKYTAHYIEWNKYYLLGMHLISMLAIVFSILSVVLAGYNYYPDIEFDVKAIIEQRKRDVAEKTVKDQKLGDFADVEKM